MLLMLSTMADWVPAVESSAPSFTVPDTTSAVGLAAAMSVGDCGEDTGAELGTFADTFASTLTEEDSLLVAEE